MNRDASTLISIAVLAAKLANELPRWVNEATQFIEVDGRVREQAVFVSESHHISEGGLDAACFPVPPHDLIVMQSRRYVLEGTWIDGLYELHIGFGELSNTVLYHADKLRPVAAFREWDRGIIHML